MNDNGGCLDCGEDDDITWDQWYDDDGNGTWFCEICMKYFNEEE